MCEGDNLAQELIIFTIYGLGWEKLQIPAETLT